MSGIFWHFIEMDRALYRFVSGDSPVGKRILYISSIFQGVVFSIHLE